jgi:hypothetical protein
VIELVPAGVWTVMSTVTAECDGNCWTVMDTALSTLKQGKIPAHGVVDMSLLPTKTSLAPVRSLPLTPMLLPPLTGPELGEMPVTAGSCW